MSGGGKVSCWNHSDDVCCCDDARSKCGSRCVNYDQTTAMGCCLWKWNCTYIYGGSLGECNWDGEEVENSLSVVMSSVEGGIWGKSWRSCMVE